jgi:hypothetical protein
MKEIPSNGQYGYRSDTAAATAGAPLAGGAAPTTPVNVTGQRARNKATPVTPITAPTARPGEPVTAGATVGPGYTPETPIPNRYAMINKYAELLDTMAAQNDAPPEFKEFWNYVKTEARNTQ